MPDAAERAGAERATLARLWRESLTAAEPEMERFLVPNPDAHYAAFREGVDIGHGGQSEIRSVTVNGERKAIAAVSLERSIELRKGDLAAQTADFQNVPRRIIRGTIRVMELGGHPNIERVEGLFVRNDTIYIVKELLEEETLEGRLKKMEARAAQTPEGIRRLWQEDAQECLAIFHGIAEAIAFGAHYNLVHRDLKPSNVCFRDRVPKVIDWGLGRLVEERKELTEQTVVGTPHYSSPEQMRGDMVTTASDVWSFGSMVFRAYLGENGAQLLYGQTARFLEQSPGRYDFEKGVARFIGQHLAAQGVDGLEQVIFRTLKANPGERLESEKLARMLNRLERGERPYGLFCAYRERRATNNYAWEKTDTGSRTRIRRRQAKAATTLLAASLCTTLLTFYANSLHQKRIATTYSAVKAFNGELSPPNIRATLAVLGKNQREWDERMNLELMISRLRYVPISSRIFSNGAYHVAVGTNINAADFAELHLRLADDAKDLETRKYLFRMGIRALQALKPDLAGDPSDYTHYGRSRYAVILRNRPLLDRALHEGILPAEELRRLVREAELMLAITAYEHQDSLRYHSDRFLLRGERATSSFMAEGLRSAEIERVLTEHRTILARQDLPFHASGETTVERYVETLLAAASHVARHQEDGLVTIADKETMSGLRPINQNSALDILLSAYETILELEEGAEGSGAGQSAALAWNVEALRRENMGEARYWTTLSETRRFLATAIAANLHAQYRVGNGHVFSDQLFYSLPGMVLPPDSQRTKEFWTELGHGPEDGGLVYAARNAFELARLVRTYHEARDDFALTEIEEAKRWATASLTALFSRQGAFSNAKLPMSDTNPAGLLRDVVNDVRYQPFMGPSPFTDNIVCEALEIALALQQDQEK